MPFNIYILFTSFLTVALGELDFAVHIEGGPEAANRLAEKHQMVNMGEIIPETGYFLLRTKVSQHLIPASRNSNRLLSGKQSTETKPRGLEESLQDGHGG